MCKLRLLESHCLPIIMYSIESFYLKSDELAEVNSWWNAVYRKIFKFNKWESVKALIFLSERLDVVHMINLRCINFIKNMLHDSNHNKIVQCFINNYVKCGECVSVLEKFKCCINWSKSKIKAVICEAFRLQVAERLNQSLVV